MKKFINNNIAKKTLSILLIVILSFGVIPPKSYGTEDKMEAVGGVLFKPVLDFLLSMSDAVMEIGNKIICNTSGFATLNYIEFKGTTPSRRETIKIPSFTLTPEAIFANEIPLLDVNFFNPSTGSSAEKLSSPIAKWFVATRNVALVGMLSVLAYIAIRMILSTVSAQKAKYKQFMLDWIVGILILFFMHYIMSFMVTVVEKVSEGIAGINKDIQIEVEVDNKYFKVAGNTREQIVEENEETLENIEAQLVSENEDSKTYSVKGGITALIRQQANDYLDNGDVMKSMGYVIIYMVLVIYTGMFLIKYLKRLINIAFLTVISPMVAFTYPIDKVRDGKAQAFGIWLKEYIINLLLQPMHLILYTVLMGTVIDLAKNNPLYALVALGFMAGAESIVRNLFRFNDSSTADNGSFVGGAMVMQGVNSLRNRAAKKQGKHAKQKAVQANEKLRFANRTADNPDEQYDFIYGGMKTNNSTEASADEADKAAGDITKKAEKQGTEEKENTEQTNKQSENEQKAKTDAEKRQKKMEEDKENKDNIRMKNVDKDAKKAKRRAIAGAALKTGAKYLRKGGGKLVKGYITATGAATLGMIGIAAGLASDKYENVATWGAAAATGGAVVGKMVGDKAENTIVNTGDVVEGIRQKANAIRDEFNESVYEDDPEGLDAYRKKRSDEEFMHSKSAQQKYRDKFGTSKYKEAMQKAIEYRKMGITDDNVIMKAMKLKGNGFSEDLADTNKIRAAIIATKVNKEKEIELLSKRLKAKGAQEQEVETLMEQVRKIKGML